MYNISNIDVTKFYFNNKWCDYYEIDVAGIEGFQNYSVTPAITTKTETINGVDGEFEVSSQYAPRIFAIPIVINNQDKIRQISSWLGSKTEQKFFFANDRIQLKAKIDSAIDIKHYLQAGLAEIKFKASNPYFEEINKTKYIITKNISAPAYNFSGLQNLIQTSAIDYVNFADNTISFETNSLTSFNIWNDGSVSSKPLVKVYGSGDLTVGINGNTFTLTSVSSYITVDFKSFEVYKDSTMLLSKFTTTSPLTIQSFNMIPEWNTISCSSGVTKIEITPRSRWI